MIYRRNSTISIKMRPCKSCGKDSVIFSRGRCANCAKIEDTHAKIAAAEREEVGMPELIERLDDLVSQWVRYSAVGPDGLVECFTCRKRFRPQDVDAGHYLTRECKYLRFDLRNIRPQCRPDNRSKYGMRPEFGKRLDEENEGITEILLEESRIIHHWTRDELKQMILEFEQKIKQLK
jgi:hypothetical protein